MAEGSVTLRIEFSQRSVERSESARPQVLQVILSAFWRIVDKKGTDPFGDFGDHRHFSRRRSILDFRAGIQVETFDDLIFDRVGTENFDRQSSRRASTFGKVSLRLKLMNSG